MSRYTLLILLLLSLIFLVMGATQRAAVADEGFSVYNAMRVMDGELPYRDFYALYAPGQFYTMAGLFRVFGLSLSVSRGFDVLLRLLLAVLVYLLARKLMSEKWALVPAVLAILTLGTCANFGYAMFPALVFSLLSALCLLEFIAGKRPAWLLAAGLATGVAEIYRQDVGFYTLACLSFVLLLYSFVHAPERRWRHILRWKLLYLAGVGLVVIPVVLYFIANGSARDFWLDLFVFPATILHGVRSTPYPSFFPSPLPLSNLRGVAGGWIRFYGPPILAFWVLIQTAFAWRANRQSKRSEVRLYGTVVLAILSLLLFAQAWSRNDPVHLIPMTIPAFILAVQMLAGYKVWRRPLLAKAAAGFVIAILASVYVVTPLKKWAAAKSIYSLAGCPSPNGRAGCVSIEPDQAQAIRFVRNHISRGDNLHRKLAA